MRYRLRFLLQEFELTGPEVVLGRSPACQITIEDPLVSRKHAIIRIADEGAFVRDLGSRNGVRINGKPIYQEETSLQDGDRIRIGTQELVFYIVRRERYAAKPTGFMKMCDACQTPYPEGAMTCPHCGAPTSNDDDTISGFVVEPRQTWTLQLLTEVIERALTLERLSEAERVMRRASEEINYRMKMGERLDPHQVHTMTQLALRLARSKEEQEWVSWAVDLYASHRLLPSEDVLAMLEDSQAGKATAQFKEAVEELVRSWGVDSEEISPTDMHTLDRLKQMCAAIQA